MSQRGSDTPAVILRTAPMRESDLVVVLCTATHGKVPTAARGARRSKRRFAGGLPVGARGEARIAQGRGSLWNFEAFTPTADHASLGRDLQRFAYANYLCELTDRLTVELDPVPSVFEALWESLDALHTHGCNPLQLRAFELRLLAYIGSLPEFDRCAACGEALSPGPVPFDAGRGGGLCARHAGAGPRIDPLVLSLGKSLLRTHEEGVQRAVAADPNATPVRRKALRDLCVSLVHQHLNRPLRSIAFFKELGQLGKGAAKGDKADQPSPAAAPAPEPAPQPGPVGPTDAGES